MIFIAIAIFIVFTIAIFSASKDFDKTDPRKPW